jgi:hypothetical protein
MRGPRWHALALVGSGCLSTPPSSLTADCPAADWADAAPETPDAVGNVLSLDFEDAATAYTFRDRSGHRRDAARLTGATATGKHGNSMLSGSDSYAVVADDGFMLGRELTIAAWINLEQTGASAIFSDYDGTAAEYDLHVDSVGRLVFLSTGAGVDHSTVSSSLITNGNWFHVAATWSGDTVTLFVDGAEVKSDDNFVNTPTPHQAPFTIGRRPDDGAVFDGMIDDLRVWDRALTVGEISEFMNQPDLAQRCGDGAIEQAEDCELGNPCCLECGRVADGCGAAGCGADGVCLTDCGAPSRGLVALYRFDEGQGTIVHDVSGVDTALDLEIATADFEWTAEGLELTGARAGSADKADKIVDAIERSGEFTIDTWMTPGDQAEDDLARLVSVESGARDLILGVWNASYVGRFAVDSTAEGSGQPALEAFDAVRLGHATHLVLTRSTDGTRRFYVDGALRDQNRAGGDLGWDSAPLFIGGNAEGARSFVGTLHRVAIHSVALDPIEVAASFHAGPRR